MRRDLPAAAARELGSAPGSRPPHRVAAVPGGAVIGHGERDGRGGGVSGWEGGERDGRIGHAAVSDTASLSPPATVLCWFWHACPLRSAMPGLLVDLVRGGGEVADDEEKLRGGEKGW